MTKLVIFTHVICWTWTYVQVICDTNSKLTIWVILTHLSAIFPTTVLSDKMIQLGTNIWVDQRIEILSIKHFVHKNPPALFCNFNFCLLQTTLETAVMHLLFPVYVFLNNKTDKIKLKIRNTRKYFKQKINWFNHLTKVNGILLQAHLVQFSDQSCLVY